MGLLTADAPKYAVLLPLAAVGLLAVEHPPKVIIGSLVLFAVNEDVLLHLRLQAGGVPISILNLLPVALLVSALSIRRSSKSAALPRALTLAIALLAIGLCAGLVLGELSHGSSYQLLRAGQLELGLVIGVVAAAIGGSNDTWRAALVRGMLWAAALTSVELLLTFGWAVATNQSLWSQLGVAPVSGDVSQQVALGHLDVVRSVSINTFLGLPALGIALVHPSRKRYALSALIIVSVLLSLTRSAWLTLVGTLATLVAYLLVSGAFPIRQKLRFVVAVTAGSVLTLAFAGSYIQARISQSGQQADVSAQVRGAETRAAWTALTSGATIVTGTGAGVILPAVQAAQQAYHSGNIATPFLENSVLSRWSNFTLLSVIGSLLLLMGAFVAGWKAVARDKTERAALGAAAFCLPAVWLGGLISGSLESPGTLPFFALAGTALTLARPKPTTNDE